MSRKNQSYSKEFKAEAARTVPENQLSISEDASRLSVPEGTLGQGESFWGTLKNESLSHHRFNTRDEAISVIRECIEIFYNRQRRHSRMGNISPAAFGKKDYQRAAKKRTNGCVRYCQYTSL
ncbi:TPA: IS3 family transposase [Salmonella enterica]|nr:IS3 family transposase [Salmonella enterica]